MNKFLLLHIIQLTLLSTYIFSGTPTPTPNPRPIELTCDTQNITTKAYPVYKESKKHEIIFLSPKADTSNPNISIDTSSLKLLNDEGEYTEYIAIDNVGEWRTGIFGSITFVPADDFNGTSSVYYVINNNCNYPIGLSNQATATVKIEGSNRPLPVIDPLCMFVKEENTTDDTVYMHNGEKLKVINVFNNDYSGLEQQGFINSSLRISPTIEKVVRRMHIKNKGTWIANTNTGQIFFIPEKNFTGEAHMTYVMDSVCTQNSHYLPIPGRRSYFFNAEVTIISTPTPTPTPCPKIKDPVCGVENICTTEDEKTVCQDSIPKQNTYANKCELEKDNAIFIYNGKCRQATPTPIPTPTITPTPTPTPKPVKPITNLTQTVEINTTRNTPIVKSSNGAALGSLSLLALMIFTGMIGFFGMRREEV